MRAQRLMIDDPYPSRMGGAAQRLPRKDPVVYGLNAPGPLTREELDTYDRDGFLVFEQLLTPDEVALLSAELERLRVDPEVVGTARAVIEPGASRMLRSIFEVHMVSPLFNQLVRDPRLVDRCRQLLGGGVYIHQSRVDYKPGFDGMPFHWHSDFEAWHIEDGMPRMRALSCSINLTENNEFNGPLLIIPGSHRQFVSCVGESPQEHYKESLRRQRFGVPDSAVLTDLVHGDGIVSCKGPPGSVTLFDCNVMHASTANITPYPRSNIFFVYNSIENTLGEPLSGQPPRPEHIASRNFREVGSLG